MKRTGVSFGLAALLALSCLVSCITKDNTLGTALVPANQDVHVRVAEFDLPVGMKMADSLQTSVSQSVTVGAIRSDCYGLYHSEAAMSVTAAYDSIIWGKNPTVNSVKLTLICDTTLIVDPTQRYIPQNLHLYRLKVDLDSTLIYNNSLSADDYEAETLSTGGTVFTGGTSYTVDLDKKLGEELLKIPMATLDSAELFMKAFKGLYLTCDDPLEGTEGGRLNTFDLSSSYITFSYNYDDDDGARRTTTETFLVGEYYCVNICSSGARPLERALAADALYLEGNCGIKPHINAVALRSMIENFAAENDIELERIAIAKAILYFPFEYNGDYRQFDYYAPTIYACTRSENSAGYLYYSPIDEIEDSSFESGDIDRASLCYPVNISNYLQALLKSDPASIDAGDDLWIMPTVTTYNSYTGATYYYADTYYYTQSLLNGTSDARHPVLKLTFAVLL